MAEMKGNVAVTFDIKPMVTIPLEEYRELKRRAELSEELLATILNHQKSLRVAIRDVYHGWKEEQD